MEAMRREGREMEREEVEAGTEGEGISREEVRRDRNSEQRMAEEMPTYSVSLQMLTPFLSTT